MPGAVDGILLGLVALAAWRGYARGGATALASLAGFGLGAWLLAGRAAALTRWAEQHGVLAGLAGWLRPVVTAWLPPEVARAPVRPDTVLRALDALAALPLPDPARRQLADGLRSALLAAETGGTLADLLAGVVAGALLVDLCLYALPLAAGLVAAAAGRRVGALLRGRGLGALDRGLGALAGAVEGAAVLAVALFLLDRVAALWPRPPVPVWLSALEGSRVAGWLVRGLMVLWPGGGSGWGPGGAA